mmetsp:Transcript_56388/g.132238  ORF Transcript_56388/g.132238 Transcript_56388/m.132238 type:complete len:123 (+) Transcript_56388:641-1009(+)
MDAALADRTMMCARRPWCIALPAQTPILKPTVRSGFLCAIHGSPHRRTCPGHDCKRITPEYQHNKPKAYESLNKKSYGWYLGVPKQCNSPRIHSDHNRWNEEQQEDAGNADKTMAGAPGTAT